MWFPPPVVVPFVFETHSNTCEDSSARTMWHIIPFDQRSFFAVNQTIGFRNDPPNAEDGRKFMLNRSLFELLWVNHFLELTDPKLLGWYLALPVEDRASIQRDGGFLQFLKRHPALEIARKFVYIKHQIRGNLIAPKTTPTSTEMSSNLKSRYPKLYGVSRCQNCGTSCPFGIKKCSRCGIHIQISEESDERQLELLPNRVREELNIITAKSGVSETDLQNTSTRISQRSYHGPPPTHKSVCNPQTRCLSQLWEEVEKSKDTKRFKDSTAQASFSLDMELEMQSLAQKNDYTQSHLSHVELECDADQETQTEYYSFSSFGVDYNEWSENSQNMEAGYNDSIMATKGSTEPSEMTMASAANSTDGFSSLCNSFELADNSGDHYEGLENKNVLRNGQQIEENHREINVGSALKSTSSVQCGASCAPAFSNQTVDACGDFRACFTSTCATEVCQLPQEKACRDVATDTEPLTVSYEKDTQTIQKSISEKSTITEIYMSDLDILTEEFIQLKEMEKELKQLKNRKERPSSDFAEKGGVDPCRRVCWFDCSLRARRADLHLLALQFLMCQQHCLKCYFTSPLGESPHQGTEALPDIMTEMLNTLEKDYHEMRRQILAGIPLDHLKPLSVDSEKIITGTYYSPASVLKAHIDLYGCEESALANVVDEECKAMRAPFSPVTDTTQDEPQDDSSKKDRAVVILNKQPVAFIAIKDLNCSETWFDAEEELGSPNQDGKMKKQREERESINYKMNQKGTDENESNESSLLCVTCLPSNLTEHEVLLWFEKYNATSVCISTFSNNIRAAIVYLKNPTDAKAAVKDLNGCCLQGHTVQVQQLCGPASTDPKLSDQSHNTSETHKTEPAGDRPKMKGVLHYKSSQRGPRCSVDRLTNVCDSPTASGTCVPQHYATMGSYDTIMARLAELHPNISRQRIIDAMMVLRAKHQGCLSGLPLRSIVDMTSELLTKTSMPKCI
ncbi:RNA-binding protein 44-like isoform X1 [Xyrauchen texanus]|uniref:RNA-binding protein 44-like isoform X1 n=2 Tax=Xyrauchen texanus TaxID=154827 RepID=UPI002242A58A|nr:RNA-binding protein 44-like isoform X1 [Xyrauchen texanus]